MFLDFFNLREQPFGVTPDPRYLYLSPTHREALASLLYGIRCNRGFMTLIAPPGMGKTTLLFCLLERLRNSSRTAFLFNTQCNSQELLRHLSADLGIENVSRDVVEMHQQLNKLLIREAEKGRRVVVIIDEAQNLSDDALESVRLLSNFETASAKLIHVILAGQPPLADKLARPSLAQLRQRLSIMARLEPFTPAETDLYIQHRLWSSGYSGKLEPFNAEARALIAAFSEGIPRNINNLCFNAMSLGFAMQKKMIDGAIVREVVADTDIAALGSERPASACPRPSIVLPAESVPEPQSAPEPQSVPRPQPVPVPLPGQNALIRALAMAGEDSPVESSMPTGTTQPDRPADVRVPLPRVPRVSFSPIMKGGSPRRVLQVAMVGALLLAVYSLAISPPVKDPAVAAALPEAGMPTAILSSLVADTVRPSVTPAPPSEPQPARSEQRIVEMVKQVKAKPIAQDIRPVTAVIPAAIAKRPSATPATLSEPQPARSEQRIVEMVKQVKAKPIAQDIRPVTAVIPAAIAKINNEQDAAPRGVVGVVGGVPGGVVGGVLSAAGVPPPVLPKTTVLKRIRVGGQVEAAKLITQAQPDYPLPAKVARIEGLVRLEALISKDGTIQDLKVLQGHPLLAKSVMDAARRWRYQPTLLNGEPVEVITEIDADFKLSD